MSRSSVPIKTVVLTGVSGTGKTTVAELFHARNPKHVFLMPSLVRDGYAAFGVKNEKEKALLSKDRESELQQFLLDYFIRETKEKLRLLKGSGVTHMVLQRSVIDILSYISKDIPVTLYSTRQLTLKATAWLEAVKPVHFHFPYPTPWKPGGEGADDGWRGASTKKDSLEALALEEAIWARLLAGACEQHNKFDLKSNFHYLSGKTEWQPAQRVATIEKLLGIEAPPNFAI